MKRSIDCLLALAAIFLAACSGGPAPGSPTLPAAGGAQATGTTAAATIQPSETAAVQPVQSVTSTWTATAAPSASAQSSPTPQPSATSTPPSVLLYYQDYSQFELVGPSGFRVLIDVMDPGWLSAPPQEQDLLLTTHGHFDHFNQAFADAFPGQELRMRAGEMVLPDGRVTGIASAHNAGDAFFQTGGSNYIFLIEMAGLRIAHFGDIGQERLSAAQMEVLGDLDVAIIQLANPFSDMGIDNLKAFRLLDQIRPKLIIPTHLDDATAAHAAGQYPAYFSQHYPLVLTASQLSAESRVLFLGAAARYGAVLDLDAWK